MELREQLENIRNAEGPVLSLYQDTVRSGEDEDLGPIQFKKLVNSVEAQINEEFEADKAKELMTKLREIQKDKVFWSHRGEGMAIFARGDAFEVVDLKEDVRNYAVVKDHMHLLPLITAEQHIKQHYILDLSRDNFRLYESNLTTVVPVKIEEVEDEFKNLYSDFDLSRGAYRSSGQSHHQYSTGEAQREIDQGKFYRYLDNELTPLLEAEKQPVLLAGVKESVSDWLNTTDSKIYVREALGKPYADFSREELKKRTKEIFYNLNKKNIKQDLESLAEAIADQEASTDLDEIKEALEAGRVDTLYIRQDWSDEDADELDALIRATLKQGGSIDIVSTEAEDFDHKLAALYRY